MEKPNVTSSNSTLHSFEGKTKVLGATTEFTSIQLFDDHLAVSVSRNIVGW